MNTVDSKAKPEGAECTAKVVAQEYSKDKTMIAQYRIVEDFLTILLNLNTNVSNGDNENLYTDLHCIGHSIKTFHDGNECNDFIRNFKGYKVFLILSDTFGITYIPLIHDASQLDSIYLLCVNITDHEHLIKQWRKLRGVFNDITAIYTLIKKETRRQESDLTPFSVILASHPVDMNELDHSFIYSQLLEEILLEIQYHEEAKQDFANFLRSQYAESTFILYSINKFEQDYDIHSPVWWYTKELFIYSVLNKALRIQHIEIIIKMGFFVKDLCRQIEQVYLATRPHIRQTLYRGQGMSSGDFQKLQHRQDGLVLFKSFLSTSVNEQVAFTFADSARMDPDLIGILFRIEIDPSISSMPYASLDDISYYSNWESEILFTINTVFRIGNIVQMDDQLWQIDLMLTSDDDVQLKNVTDYIRKEFEDSSANHRLGRLMLRMGKLNKAEEIFMKLLESTSDENLKEIADLHMELGNIKYQEGDGSNALAHFEKGLALKEQILRPTDPELAQAHSSIGTTYGLMSNYWTALEYHEKALRIREEVLSPEDPNLGATYHNIGCVYYSMGNYSAARYYYEKALNIRVKTLPSLHPKLAITYNNIGYLDKLAGDYSNALLNYEKALTIEERSLPPTHSSLGTTYNNIAGVHRLLKDYSNTLMYLEKTLKIQQASLSPIHPDLAITYNNIAAVHISMNDYSIAFSNLQKALEIQEKSPSPDYPTLAKIYINIGGTHSAMKEYSNALSFYEKALQIQQKSLSSSHPDLAPTYNKMGHVFHNLGQYEKAIEYVQRAVDILRETSGLENSSFQTYQEDLDRFCQKL